MEKNMQQKLKKSHEGSVFGETIRWRNSCGSDRNQNISRITLKQAYNKAETRATFPQPWFKKNKKNKTKKALMWQ